VHSSSSRSAVVARTRLRPTSYHFFTSVIVVTMASSFFKNSVASAAWWSSSMASGGGGVAHQEVAFTGDAAKGERVAGP
jgi:hypothetical protein